MVENHFAFRISHCAKTHFRISDLPEDSEGRVYWNRMVSAETLVDISFAKQ